MQIFIDRLNEGENLLDFTVEELREVLDGEFDLQDITPLTLNITRRGKFLYVAGSNRMQVEFDCDRCAETTSSSYDVELELVFHLGEYKVKDEEDATIVLPAEEKIIDFSEYYVESALLAVPYIRHCSDNCKGLCPQCGANLNHTECDCNSSKQIDPRWQQLVEISEKMKKNEN